MKRRQFLGTLGGLSILPSPIFAADLTGGTASVKQPPGRRTLLLVDDHYILYRAGTKRVFHPPIRHPQNPLLHGNGKPWDVDIAYNSVYRNPSSGLYQIWYQAFAGDVAREKTHRCTVCYAESADGIHWIKPNLGLFTFNGIKETNIVLLANGGTSDRYGASVIYDPLEKDSTRRYKMAYFDFSRDSQGKESAGLNVAFSPDGIHWNKYAGGTLLPAARGNLGQPLPYQAEAGHTWALPLSMSDALDVFYDPKRKAYVCCGKMWTDGPEGNMFWKHAMGRTQSNDFIHWSRPELILTPDDADPPYVEFHTSPVFFYNECYFSGIQILHRAERGGVIDIELALSRDGINWERPFRHPYFIPKNSGNQFDSGSIFTNATPIILEDEIRFYYGGYSQGATGSNDAELISGIGLVTLPRDRFAGLRPQQTVGQVTFKPVNLKEFGSLSLNGNAAEGHIWCEVLSGDGFRLPGFTREDTIPINSDSLRHVVRWKDNGIEQLPGDRHILRIHLENAEVFAISLADKL